MVLPALALILALLWFAVLRPGYREAVAETGKLWSDSGPAWRSTAFLLELGRATGLWFLRLVVVGLILAALFAIGGGALVVFGVAAFFALRYVIRRYEAVRAEPVTPCGWADHA